MTANAGPACPHCLRTTPDGPLVAPSSFQLEQMREIRDGDVRAGDGSVYGSIFWGLYLQGLMYVETLPGNRHRWRLSPAGKLLADSTESP
jgi:hypothetical protein